MTPFNPQAQGLHDGSLGDRALLHRIPLQGPSEKGADLTVGSITYYLDTDCFRSRGIQLAPGLLDIVGRFRLPKLAAQNPQTRRVNPEPLCPDDSLPRLPTRHHPCTVPAHAPVAGANRSLVRTLLPAPRHKNRSHRTRSAAARYRQSLQDNLPRSLQPCRRDHLSLRSRCREAGGRFPGARLQTQHHPSRPFLLRPRPTFGASSAKLPE